MSNLELERTYTVPLSRAWITPRYRRTKRAVNILKEFAERHMKSGEIKIETSLNEVLWNRGITNPPRRITVTMSKDEDGIVTISLPKLEGAEQEIREEEGVTAASSEAPSLGTRVEEEKETQAPQEKTKEPRKPEEKAEPATKKTAERKKKQKIPSKKKQPVKKIKKSTRKSKA